MLRPWQPCVPPRRALSWPTWRLSPTAHTGSLSQALSDIRRALNARCDGDAYLSVTLGAVRFLPDSDHWLDAECILSAVAGQHEQTGTRQQDLDGLEATVALYRGPFLEGLSLADCAAVEEWVLLQRERLERALRAALDLLVDGHASAGAHARALAHAWRRLDLDPWREDAHRQVMELLALDGQRGAALRQYDACCRVLADELGVVPDPATRDLYERIAQGAIAQVHSRASVRQPPTAPRHNLPAPLTALVGRRGELEAAADLLADPSCRLLTLMGPGGIGKTRLAIEIARGQVGEFRNGVILVSLSGIEKVSALVPSIAQALGQSIAPDGAQAIEQLYGFLRRRELLLVLDSAEHLVAVDGEPGLASVLTDLLAAAPEVKALVTSRIKLGLLGEHVLPLGPLAYCAAGEPSGDDAAALFVQGARRVLPTFELNAANRTAAVHICSSVEGHPLALLMAASWVSSLQVADIAAALGGGDPGVEGLDLLEADWRDVPDRHRSVRAIFERSWYLLDPRARRVLAAMAVFPDGFTRDAAREVADASPQVLRALTDASLLTGATSGRYAMHALIRWCAVEKLDRDPVSGRRVRQLLCSYTQLFLERLSAAEGKAGMKSAIDAAGGEVGSIRAAWDWAVEIGDTDYIDRAVHGLSLLYAYLRRGSEGVAACVAAESRLKTLALEDRRGAATHLRVLAKVLEHFCWFFRELDDQSREAAARRALAVLDDPRVRGVDTRGERAGLLLMLGRAISSQGRRERAQELYAEGADLYGDLGKDADRAKVLVEAGWTAWCAGEFDRSGQFAEEARLLARAVGNLDVEARAAMRLSGVTLAAGRLPEAARLSEEVLEIHRRLGNPVGIASALYSLGMKRAMLMQLPEAETLVGEALRINHDHLGLDTAFEESAMAMVWMQQGRYDEALKQLGAIDATGPQYGDRLRGWTHLLLGSTQLAQGRYEEAGAALRKSVSFYRANQQMLELVSALAALGIALCMLGRTTRARAALVEALSLFRRARAKLMLANALSGCALLSARQGKVTRAVELLGVVQGLPHYTETPWLADVVGRHIDAAIREVGLTEAEVVAARARGRAMDVEWVIDQLLTREESG